MDASLGNDVDGRAKVVRSTVAPSAQSLSAAGTDSRSMSNIENVASMNDLHHYFIQSADEMMLDACLCMSDSTVSP